MLSSQTMTHLARLAVLCALAVSAISCAPAPATSSRARGQTDYLYGFGPSGIPSQPSYATPPKPAPPPEKDDFNFWEDDGQGGPVRIKLDLSEQAAYFYRGSRLVGRSRISSGKSEKPTPVGSFKIFNKDADHKSSTYGWIRDADDTVINYSADIRKHKVPKGGRFENADMKWYNQFYPAIGMHAGILPGYPASHGCVRMPEEMARLFYQNSPIGTPVQVVR